MWKPIALFIVLTILTPYQSHAQTPVFADCRAAYQEELKRQGQKVSWAWDHDNVVQTTGYIAGAAVAVGITVSDAIKKYNDANARSQGLAVGAAAGAAIVGGAATIRAASSSTYEQKAKDYDIVLTLLNQAVDEDGMDLQIFANSLINSSTKYSQFTVEDVTYALQKGNQDGSFCRDWHEPASMEEITKKVKRT